ATVDSAGARPTGVYVALGVCCALSYNHWRDADGSLNPVADDASGNDDARGSKHFAVGDCCIRRIRIGKRVWEGVSTDIGDCTEQVSPNSGPPQDNRLLVPCRRW